LQPFQYLHALCDPIQIDFPIYRLHSVGYIWEQEGILQWLLFRLFTVQTLPL